MDLLPLPSASVPLRAHDERSTMPISAEDARGPEEPAVTLAIAGIANDVARGREAAGAHEARAAPHKGSASVPASPNGPGGGNAVEVEDVRVEMGHAFLKSTLDGGFIW